MSPWGLFRTEEPGASRTAGGPSRRSLPSFGTGGCWGRAEGLRVPWGAYTQTERWSLAREAHRAPEAREHCTV